MNFLGSASLLAKNEFKQTEFDSLQKQCTKYLDNHKNELAFELFEQLEAFEIPKDNLEALANFIGLKGAVEGRKGNHIKQYALLKQYEDLAQKINTNDRIGSSYLNLGSYYEQFDDYSNAMPFFQEALKYYKKSNNELKIAYLYNKLGLIAYQEDKYELAIDYFLATYLAFKKHQYEDPVNAYWMQNALSNIGLAYRYLNQNQHSLKYLKYAYNFCQTQAFEKERPMAVILSNIGATYFKMEKYDSAIRYLEAGTELCLKPANNELYHGINSLIFSSKIYRKMGKINLAQRNLNRALIYIHIYQIPQLYPSYLFNLGENQFAEKKYDLAYQTQVKYSRLKDSLQALDNKIVIGKEFLQHQLEKERDHNYSLEKENQINSLQRNIYLAITLAVILILIISIYNYKKLNFKNTELLALNKQILQQKEDVAALNDKLAQINLNKSYLMQSIAHDLRAPIGNIIGLNELMEAESNEDSDLHEYFPLIKGSCQLSINIIEDILDQSMIEKGSFDLHKTSQDIQAIIQESIQILHFKSAPKKIQIIPHFQSNELLLLDGERMKRVFINILMNAIKYSSRGDLIQVFQKIENNWCIIQIQDQGIGMQQETITKIFDKNTSVRKEGTEHEATVGIGLSITKLIVEGHGGRIRVESKPNSGSSFYIELPLSV